MSISLINEYSSITINSLYNANNYNTNINDNNDNEFDNLLTVLCKVEFNNSDLELISTILFNYFTLKIYLIKKTTNIILYITDFKYIKYLSTILENSDDVRGYKEITEDMFNKKTEFIEYVSNYQIKYIYGSYLNTIPIIIGIKSLNNLINTLDNTRIVLYNIPCYISNNEIEITNSKIIIYIIGVLSNKNNYSFPNKIINCCKKEITYSRDIKIVSNFNNIFYMNFSYENDESITIDYETKNISSIITSISGFKYLLENSFLNIDIKTLSNIINYKFDNEEIIIPEIIDESNINTLRKASISYHFNNFKNTLIKNRYDDDVYSNNNIIISKLNINDNLCLFIYVFDNNKIATNNISNDKLISSYFKQSKILESEYSDFSDIYDLFENKWNLTDSTDNNKILITKIYIYSFGNRYLSILDILINKYSNLIYYLVVDGSFNIDNKFYNFITNTYLKITPFFTNILNDSCIYKNSVLSIDNEDITYPIYNNYLYYLHLSNSDKKYIHNILAYDKYL